LQFDDFIIYEFCEWMEHNRLKLNDCPIPRVNCVFPFILLPGKENECTDTQLDDIENVLRTGLRFHIGLNILKLNMFSVAPAPK
jgi:hypothetical protein